MKVPRERSPAYALVFAASLPHLQQIAREHGYALAVHGSMRTDLDLIAAPWVDEASPAEELIEALRVGTNGFFREEPEGWERSPVYRSHGRRAWSIYLDPGQHYYLDISVMPRECDWGTDAIQNPLFREP